MSIHLLLKRSARRGQTLVMMAATGMVLALALMGIINVYQGVRLKIEVQAAADAAAYSTALTEARTFNFFAITNRAMAAHFAGTMLLYSELSYVTAVDDTLRQSELAWGDVRDASTCNLFNPTCCLMRQVAGHVRSDRARWRQMFHPILHAALQLSEHEWWGMDLAARHHYNAAMSLADAQSVAWQSLEKVIKNQMVANSVRHKLDDLEDGSDNSPYGNRLSAHVWPSEEEAPSAATWKALTRVTYPLGLPVVQVHPDNGSFGADWMRQGINDISSAANGARYDWGARQDFRLGSEFQLMFRYNMPHLDDHQVNGAVAAALLFQSTNITDVRGEAQSIQANAGISGNNSIRNQVRRNGNAFDGTNPRTQFSGAIGAYTDIDVTAKGVTALCNKSRTRTAQSAMRISSPLSFQNPLHQVHTASNDSLPGTFVKHRPEVNPRDAFPISIYPSVAHFNPGDLIQQQLQNQPSTWVLMEAQPQGIGTEASGNEDRMPWQLRGRFRFGVSGAGREYDLGITSGGRRGRDHQVFDKKRVGVMGALARGLTYYHRPPLNSPNGAQSWAERPNFMNPFWRAKLELFTTGGNQSEWPTAQQILADSGYPATQAIASEVPPAL
ncbi:hypothetical protein [Hyalangium versicolor]|uniref:hypothetical protein n=1 Tax=Hyalangium versicolor TaxID=2861190 RepID=UPI001CCC91D2|nr:hypothetical protein [Hyalangium versicolor]